MDFDLVSHSVIGAAIKVHSALGPGLFEEVYKVCLRHELLKMGLEVNSEVIIPIVYDGLKLEIGYRADLIVEGELIVELKSVPQILPVHKSQLLTYLKLAEKEVGLLLNFNSVHLRQGIIRIVNQHLMGTENRSHKIPFRSSNQIEE